MSDEAGVDFKDIKRRMGLAVEDLRQDMGGLRTGRASPSLLDTVMVDYYGTSTPLNQLGGVSVPEPRMLTVQLWDKGAVKATEKAIRDSGLGLNPQSDGTLIRIPLPDLNQERRRELVKVAGKYAEQHRIAVRNIRRDALDHLKKAEKDGDISQDDAKSQADQVQALTDDHVKQIDEMLAKKEQDIMAV